MLEEKVFDSEKHKILFNLGTEMIGFFADHLYEVETRDFQSFMLNRISAGFFKLLTIKSLKNFSFAKSVKKAKCEPM